MFVFLQNTQILTQHLFNSELRDRQAGNSLT
jgi:hypothetical protein